MGDDCWPYGFDANRARARDVPALSPRAGAVEAAARARGAVRAGDDGAVQDLRRCDARGPVRVARDRGVLRRRRAASAACCRSSARWRARKARAARSRRRQRAASTRSRADAKFDIDSAGRPRRGVAGTLAIPFVRQLTAHVTRTDDEASRYVHWGATSQDVLDTALVALRAASASRRLLDALERPRRRARDARGRAPRDADGRRARCCSRRHRFRSASRSRCGSMRSRARARRCDVLRTTAAVLQFGGASGVLAPLGADGAQVAARLAAELGSDGHGHALARRARSVARLGAEVGIACEVTAKIALDVALLMQPEIGEAFEPAGAGRGGSSALPHKRNPVGAMFAREAGLRAPGLVANLVAGVAGEHERGLGQWQSQFWTLGELFAAAGSGVDAMLEVVAGLHGRCGRDASQPRCDARLRLRRGAGDGAGRSARQGRRARACRGAVPRRAVAQGETLQQALRAMPSFRSCVPPDVDGAHFRAVVAVRRCRDDDRSRARRVAQEGPADMPFLLRDGARLWWRSDGDRSEARAAARQLARHRHDAVGSDPAAAHRALPRDPLRHARARRVGRHRRATTRSSCWRATRSRLRTPPGCRTVQLRRHFDRRHGRAVARRECAAIASTSSCSRTRRRSFPADIWAARIDAVNKGGTASIADAVLARWFTEAFLAKKPPRMASARIDARVQPMRSGYIGCCAAIRDMDQTATRGRASACRRS